MMRFVFAASGSKGNATLITDGEALIQIDMGVARKTIAEALLPWKKRVSDIEAVFITHDHSDHIKGLPYLSPSTAIYATECSLDPKNVFETIEPYVGIQVGAINVFPFSVSHDAPNPVNYLISVGEERLGYVTDTGCLDETALSLLKNCDYYLFESNHDLKMLAKSKRPRSLKARIRGDHGHLNNVQIARYLASLIGDRTKEIYLGHISQECNTPEIALETYREVFAEEGVSLEGIALRVTNQFAPVYGGDKE